MLLPFLLVRGRVYVTYVRCAFERTDEWIQSAYGRVGGPLLILGLYQNIVYFMSTLKQILLQIIICMFVFHNFRILSIIIFYIKLIKKHIWIYLYLLFVLKLLYIKNMWDIACVITKKKLEIVLLLIIKLFYIY